MFPEKKFTRSLSVEASVGVFLGMGGSTANDRSGQGLVECNPERSVYDATSNSLSISSGRISFALGLTGPCLTLDTACASSLVATHLAAASLNQRECHKALAIGAGLLSLSSSRVFATAGMLSTLGRCHTFDRRADGYCRGEGCGALLYHRASDGTGRHGHSCAFLDSAVQHDGQSATLTAPNGSSQKRLIMSVGQKRPASETKLMCLEAHGTGTALGDPIEVGAVVAALIRTNFNPTRSHSTASISCTSLKANMGHLEAAAAAAGL